MANRFSVKIPVTENPKEQEVAAVHVKELAEQDFEAQVLRGQTLLPDGIKAWRDVWSAGHAAALIDSSPPIASIAATLRRELDAALAGEGRPERD